VTLPLYITKLLSGIDLFPFEKEILQYVNFMDDVFSGMTGYSLMSFPDSVLDLCYRCNPKLPSQKEQNEKIMGYLEAD
jgi:Flp pilus assembly CpaE family ATPase